MPKSLFLSHNHQDQKHASTIRDLLRQVSAGQLDVWFSSDNRPGNGLGPGDWYKQLRGRLAKSKTLIALITPASLDNRWVHFECGLADALNATVVPVCIGLHSLNDIPAPLNRYQAYQLSDYESSKTFVGKMLELHKLEFFENIAEPVIKTSIAAFAVVDDKKPRAVQLQLCDVVEQLKSHIDNRLLGTVKAAPGKKFVPYALTFDCHAPGEDLEVVVNIEANTTITNVMDNVYFAIAKHVDPFTYLSQWVLRNRVDLRRMVIREVADLIPAHLVFGPRSEWQIVLLDAPYQPGHSEDVEKEMRGWKEKEYPTTRHKPPSGS